MIQPRNTVHSNIFYAGIFIALVALPFTFNLTLPIAIILFFNWIAEWNWKEKIARIKSTSPAMFFVFISFFVVYIIGVFYSTNKAAALSELEYKAWFLLAPLLFFTADKSCLTPKRTKFLLFAFIMSMTALIFVNYTLSFVNYLNTHSSREFYYISLSRFMHPSYSSMYACVAFIIVYYLLFISKEKLPTVAKWALVSLLLLYTIYIYCLQSKAGILAFAAIFFLLGLYWINKRGKRWGWSALFVVVMLLVPVLFLRFTSSSNNRLKATVETFKSEDGESKSKESSQLRITIWKMSWQMIVENLPMGVGSGDAKDALIQGYSGMGYDYMHAARYNSHNQYLQTMLALGIIGIASLLAHLFAPLYAAFKKKQILYLSFLIVIILNLLVESMFERRAGCDFFAIFNGLFYFMMMNDMTENDNAKYCASTNNNNL